MKNYWFKANNKRYKSYDDAEFAVIYGGYEDTIYVMEGDTQVLEIPAADMESWRQCSVCHEMIQAGYYVDHEEYYCSDKCLQTVYSWDEYLTMYADEVAYWTQWD